jgi:hypothetical protein
MTAREIGICLSSNDRKLNSRTLISGRGRSFGNWLFGTLNDIGVIHATKSSARRAKDRTVISRSSQGNMYQFFSAGRPHARPFMHVRGLGRRRAPSRSGDAVIERTRPENLRGSMIMTAIASDAEHRTQQ